jgi:hypothetical protein
MAPARPAPAGAAAAAGEGAEGARKSHCPDCNALKGFGEEEGCGPLCKLENLVKDLKSS